MTRAYIGTSILAGIEAGINARQGALSNPFQQLIKDGDTAFYYDLTDPNGIVQDESGKDTIYWDLAVGNKTYGAEQNSGNLTPYTVYLITATETDYFFNGCQVGDVFNATATTALSATNKVKRVLGNHLCTARQTSYPNSKPVDGVFDGVDDFMKTTPISISHPYSVYIVLQNPTYTQDSYIFSSNYPQGELRQRYYSPDLSIRANSYIQGNGDLPLNTWGVVRAFFNGASSKLQVDENAALTGDVGVGATITEVVFGGRSNLTMFANFVIRAVLFRKKIDTTEDETLIYEAFKKKSNLNTELNESTILNSNTQLWTS